MVDRFFFPNGFDVAQGRVELDASETDHALHSRRVHEGDSVELLNGKGVVARGVIATARKRRVVVEVKTVERRYRDGREVHLAICVPKGNRMDGLVDGATQMGIATIRPVIAERAVSAREDLSDNRVERWRRIAREAAKQSGEPFLPELAPVATLAELLTEPFEGLRCILQPDLDAAPLLSTLMSSRTPVRILVGPEGGFTEDEVRRAVSSGEVKTRLGRSILRIEMATLAAASLARFAMDLD